MTSVAFFGASWTSAPRSVRRSPFDEPRLLFDRNLDRRAQSCQPIRLLRPHQRFQPGHLGRVCEVDGLEIEPRPPNDPRRPCRDRRRGIDRAGKDGRLQSLSPRFQNRPAIVVGVDVGEQAKTGRGADFEQGQRASIAARGASFSCNTQLRN